MQGLKTSFRAGLLLFFLSTVSFVQAQEKTAEEKFEEARQMAFTGNYSGGITILEELVKQEPQNLDYPIFLARIYSWKKEYTTAMNLLRNVLEEEEPPRSAYEAIVLAYLWAGDFQQVMSFSDRALTRYSDPFFNYYKAVALESLGQGKEAEKILEELIKAQDAFREKATALLSRIYRKNSREIGLFYLNSSFNNMEPWHFTSFSYKTPFLGIPIIGRYSHAFMFGREAPQVEVDIYPAVSEGSYFYINLGFGQDLFPSFRGGIEYFLSGGSGLEFSAGSRFLDFDTSEVFLFTGSAAYTAGTTTITYRPYLSLLDDNQNLSHLVGIRFSNASKESYIQLDLQYGSVPYEFFTNSTFGDLRTFRLGSQYSFRISPHLFLHPALLYEYEEFLPGEHRHRLNAQLQTRLRF